MKDLLSESRNLSELLLSSSDLAREIFADIASDLDIPVSVARALCLLEKPEPMSGLAVKLRCDKSYITPLTDQMESLGFVERVPGADRRIKMLELTSAGEATRDKLESQIARLNPVMTGLTKAERITLEALLKKVVATKV
jgi:DNA-binding MarR family transcriptional regulator